MFARKQTKHGCIIVNSDNQPLGFGYNGFPRGLNNDVELPNTRPEKYDWMIHSEINAIHNCVIKPDNAIAYVTGECCNNCLMNLWQSGVVEVFYLDAHGTHLWNNQEEEIRREFLEQSDIGFYAVDVEDFKNRIV